MTIKEAIQKVERANPGMKVCGASELETMWVFGLCGVNGEQPDEPPCAVDKTTGEMKTFFPPDHFEELEKAIEIDLNRI